MICNLVKGDGRAGIEDRKASIRKRARRKADDCRRQRLSGRTDDRREEADDGHEGDNGRIASERADPRSLARSKCLKRPNKRNEKVEKRPRKRGDNSGAATTIKRKKCNNARRTDAE